MWFPALPSERALRSRPVDGAFALILHEKNTDRIHCLNATAAQAGLGRGMTLSDARALCPALVTRPADPKGDARFLHVLARWATRYSPWVGLEGADGLVLDITGCAHLMGDESAMLADMENRLAHAGLTVRLGCAGTRGAAWALAHYAPDIAKGQDALRPLPLAALRLSAKTVTTLERLGLRHIADLIRIPRATITRRFGPEVLLRLDQALGAQPEEISPLPEPPRFRVRITLPEPIGLAADVMAGTERLLLQLCERLKTQEAGARKLLLTLRRVDQASQQVELRLAAAMRDPLRILPLFERGVDQVDAGFGIDVLQLEATQVENMPARQLGYAAKPTDGLEDMITRIGNRIGLENVQRFLPADSHIPERSFIIAPAAYSKPAPNWPVLRERPIKIFPPEPIAGTGRIPPRHFRWRRMPLTRGRATGPERIAPEWWLVDDSWQSGVRDYWKVETKEGRRLWMYYTPQNPGWFVQGEFG